MPAAIDTAARAKPRPAIIIVITDGYTPWPPTRPTRQQRNRHRRAHRPRHPPNSPTLDHPHHRSRPVATYQGQTAS